MPRPKIQTSQLLMRNPGGITSIQVTGLSMEHIIVVFSLHRIRFWLKRNMVHVDFDPRLQPASGLTCHSYSLHDTNTAVFTRQDGSKGILKLSQEEYTLHVVDQLIHDSGFR